MKEDELLWDDNESGDRWGRVDLKKELNTVYKKCVV